MASSIAAHADTGAPDASDDAPMTTPSEADAEPLPKGDDSAAEGLQDSEYLDPDSANFDEWRPIVEEGQSIYGEEPEIRPFDWMRHWGFRHSSTDGRFIDKNVPLMHSSWLNRPYHIDWFVGPLLSDSPIQGRVKQSNEVYGGIRAGWDFDYYWGIEARYGRADPTVFLVDNTSDGISGRYMVGDVNLIYYPWGDTKVRPFFQLGIGASKVGSIRDDGTDHEATLLGTPFGIGVQFLQTHWLAWRLEVIDNLAFGSEGIDTMHNVAFSGGMEIRLGARPNSYWPWRSSRSIW